MISTAMVDKWFADSQTNQYPVNLEDVYCPLGYQTRGRAIYAVECKLERGRDYKRDQRETRVTPYYWLSLEGLKRFIAKAPERNSNLMIQYTAHWVPKTGGTPSTLIPHDITTDPDIPIEHYAALVQNEIEVQRTKFIRLFLAFSPDDERLFEGVYNRTLREKYEPQSLISLVRARRPTALWAAAYSTVQYSAFVLQRIMEESNKFEHLFGSIRKEDRENYREVFYSAIAAF